MPAYTSSDEDVSYLQRKIVFLILFVALFILIVFVRLYYLQLYRGAEYRSLSEQISVREEEIHAKRGLILDRYGKVLVSNRSIYEIAIIRQHVRDLPRLIESVSKLIPLSAEEIYAKLTEFKNSPPFVPLVLVTDAPFDWVAKLRQYQRPEYDDDTPVYLEGLEVRSTFTRVYPHAELFSHALGYLREVDEKTLKHMEETNPGLYSQGDFMGASGVERAYDEHLKGIDGMYARVVDARGKEIRNNDELGLLQDRMSFDPEEGGTLVTSLDYDAQFAAAEAFGNRKGAVVALDPTNGQVIVMYSSPAFDPNLISRNIDRAYWAKINLHPDKFLFNRAIQAMYPPGSTYKIIPSYGGLDSGLINPDTHFNCGGGMQFGNRFFRCWNKGGHGSTDVHRAIMQSCDVFFYRTGLLLGVDGLNKYAHLFGLGQKTGIEIPYEQAGLIPSTEWKMRRYKTPWIESETLSISIGQGYDLVTPLQNAYMAAMVANGGRAFKPHFGQYILNAVGEREKNFDQPLGEPALSEKNLNLVRQGLIDVVHGAGTARRLQASPYKIAGKTGTAQVVGYDAKIQVKDHALFVSYAPYDNPKIAVSVIVENGGHGGSDAAPVALKIIDTYLSKFMPAPDKGNQRGKSQFINEAGD